MDSYVDLQVETLLAKAPTQNLSKIPFVGAALTPPVSVQVGCPFRAFASELWPWPYSSPVVCLCVRRSVICVVYACVLYATAIASPLSTRVFSDFPYQNTHCT